MQRCRRWETRSSRKGAFCKMPWMPLLKTQWRLRCANSQLKGRARKLCEIVNHVHLVVVSKLVCHIRPGFRGKTRLAIESRFEPCNPREQFGANIHLLNKPSLKLAHAQSCTAGESGEFYAAAGLNDPMRCGRNAIKASGPEGLTQ